MHFLERVHNMSVLSHPKVIYFSTDPVLDLTAIACEGKEASDSN